MLADQPMITFGISVMLGAALGAVSIAGVSLGSAGILFAAIGLAAWGAADGVTIAVPEPVGFLGLVLFAFATGIISGPGFFEALRSSWPLMLAVAGVILGAAVVTFGLGRLVGLEPEAIAGVFAGSQTNTPALAAAGGGAQATVGYACAYLFGVLGMLVATAMSLRRSTTDTDAPEPLVDVTIRVDRSTPVAVADIAAGRHVTFVRLCPSGQTGVSAVTDDTVLGHGDLVSVVGPNREVDAIVADLGHRSTHDLTSDRAHLDFRRITLSNPAYGGLTVAELQLGPRHGATVSRVRRGDVDLISAPGLKLHLGDRLRVVAPPEQMAAVTALLGDSSRGMTALAPVALGGGLALGLAVGLIPVPLPGGMTVSVGAAAGALLAGLVMGRVRRVGRILTTMPLASSTVLADIGLMLFLAYAGCKAGSMIGTAFGSGEVLKLVGVGAVGTTVLASGTYALTRWVFRLGGVRSAGILGGVQTQPAILGFANERTGYDARVSLGYALVYPTAMIVKVVAAQLIASL
ncbi:aspartate-alanine antiporter-like transporter [Mycolicibacterium palauense]|uniref:aspartate-alanine antiporter-like transporter n=1 Tax=Mycolicibacterium palauense TaxID=2034511 RepID=UPI001FE70AA5|nr:TrkA C-terminal domain-containing protein [Mycolicibacterium palauense]